MLKAKAKVWVPLIAIGAFLFLIVLIVVLGGGAATDCENGSGSGSGSWGWPFDGVSDNPQYMDGGQFGNSAGSISARNHAFHDGFDWSFGMNGVKSGSTVKAIHAGTVKKVAYAKGLDWYVWVHSDDGYNEVYQETFDKSDIKVKEGDTVNVGDTIGTAHLNGHMHLGVTKVDDFNKAEASAFTDDGTWLDPVQTIKSGLNSGGSATSSGGSGSWLTKGSSGYNNAEQVFNRLIKDLGVSGAAASGVLGNLRQESGDQLTTSISNGSGDGGHGLMQWTGNRRTELSNFAKSQNLPEDSLELQIRMIEHDMTTGARWASGKYGKQTLAQFGHLSDPKDAAMRFYLSGQIAGEGRKSDPDGTGTKRQEYAQQAYQTFGGEKFQANDSILGSAVGASQTGSASSSSSTGDDDLCDDVSSTGSADGNILQVAKSLLGYFHYGQTHGISNIGSVENPNKNGITDCSGFVWLVLTKAGYSTPDNMGWYTKTMADDATGAHKWLQQIDKNEAGPGDVIIVNTGNGSGSNGHTAILEEPYKDKGENAQIINEGGAGGSGGVNESSMRQAFGSMLDSGTVIFARPVKK